MFYGTADEYRAYHTARGRDMTSQSDDAVVNQLLLVASEWIDGVFRNRFEGYKVGQRSQVREWPRYGPVDRDGYHVPSDFVPIEIEWATYEAAYRESQATGSLIKDFTPPEYRSVRIEGSIAVQYANVSAQMVQTQFPIIGQILDRLLGDYSAVSMLSSKVVRA